MVAVGGLGLVGANFWFGPQRQSLDSLIWDGQPSATAKTSLLQIGGEMVLLLILYLLAGESDQLGLAMVTIVITLWILFYMSRETGTSTQKG
jgi:hypothetical protein